MMVKMKTATCPTCGGLVFKLAGKASKLCYDECIDCRSKRQPVSSQTTTGAALSRAQGEPS